MLLSVFSLSDATTDCRTNWSHFFVTTPKKMDALSGSCLQIPCSFRAEPETDFISTRETFGVWIKSDSNLNNVIYNSSGTVNTYPMKITGNLKEKNCTTLFYNLNTTYTNTYYFRIINWPFRATAVCDPLHITIEDSPQSPSIEISGDLKEKESVTITCSAFTPCPHSPPKLTWNLQQHSHNNMEENTDGNFTTKIQETITLSDKHDGYNITCSAKYPVNEGKDVKTAEETKTLSVSYAPKNTSVSISPSGLVSAGEQVNLTCSSRAKPPVSHFIWFKISKDGPMNVSEGEFYSFTVTDGGVYYCVAMNDLGNQTSSWINLNDAGTENSLLWGSALGGIVVIILIILICLTVSIWWFKSKHQTPQQTEVRINGMLALQQSASVTEDNIHYGEINFSARKPEPVSVSVQDSAQQLDTLYAEVKVSEATNSLRQTADSPEDLYAQVKKK
uniref:sialic acid-binding Ig-like lectin 12 n=1 Tax=Semicossyphus pulcher TaxID=241346 RepID=UPI0037E83161